MKALEKGVTVRMFLGIYLTPDYRLHLNQNKEWRQSAIDHPQSLNTLTIIHFHNKEYLGMYVEDRISLDGLKISLLNFAKQFKVFLPESPLDISKLAIFPQIFIS